MASPKVPPRDINAGWWQHLIRDLLHTTGTPGVSIALVTPEGETQHVSFGRLDLDTETAPNEDTIYLTSSMSKSFVAFAIGILIGTNYRTKEKKLVTWNSRLDSILLELKGRRAGEVTLAQLADHQTKFKRCDLLWIGREEEMLIDQEAELFAVTGLPYDAEFTKPNSFENKRNYSNIAFALLGSVISRVTGEIWVKFLQESIFNPLGMTRTHFDLKNTDKNSAGYHGALVDKKLMGDEVALGYARGINELEDKEQNTVEKTGELHHYINTTALDRHGQDGFTIVPEVVRFQPCEVSRETCPMSAPAGLLSTASDLANFYKTFMMMWEGSIKQNTEEEKAIYNGVKMVKSHIEDMRRHSTPKPPATGRSTCAYAGGWTVTEFPWKLEHRGPAEDGINFKPLQSVAKLPFMKPLRETVGQAEGRFWPLMNHKSQFSDLCLAHGGNMPGASSIVMLFPKIQCAVVALTNARTFFGDAGNFAAGLMVDHLLLGRPYTGVRIPKETLFELLPSAEFLGLHDARLVDDDTAEIYPAGLTKALARHAVINHQIDCLLYEAKRLDEWEAQPINLETLGEEPLAKIEGLLQTYAEDFRKWKVRVEKAKYGDYESVRIVFQDKKKSHFFLHAHKGGLGKPGEDTTLAPAMPINEFKRSYPYYPVEMKFIASDGKILLDLRYVVKKGDTSGVTLMPEK